MHSTRLCFGGGDSASSMSPYISINEC
jgi:hypothetical protein